MFCLVFCVTTLIFGVSGKVEANEKFTAINLQEYNDFIAEHKGKIVVVNFFATWCPPCRDEIPGLVSIAKTMSKDVVVIGISGDEDVTKIAPFLKEMNVNYSVLLAEMDLLSFFKVYTIPHNLVYDKNGKIVANAAGFVTEDELKKFINMLLEEDADAKRDNS